MQKGANRLLELLAISVGLSILQPAISFADAIPNNTILFNDLTDNLSVTTTGDATGRVTFDCTIPDSCKAFVRPPPDGGTSSSPGTTLYVLEPNSQIISDTVTNAGFDAARGSYEFDFLSDSDNGLGLELFIRSG